MTEFIDSFGIYENANGSIPAIPANQVSLRRRWTTVNGGDTQTTNIGTLHDSALFLSFGGTVTKTTRHKDTWSVGINFFLNGSLAAAGGNIWSEQSCDGGNAITLFRLVLNTDGTFTLIAGNGSTVINASATAITANSWNYIEFLVAFSGTTNISVQADLYLNGTHITGGSALTGINAASLVSGTATTNLHVLGSGLGSAGSSALIQDLYVFNGDAPVNFSPLLNANTIISVIHPDGNVVQGLTRSAGSSNFILVNENPEDQDTTYVASGTPTTQDVYTWQDIVSFIGTIPVVQLSICGRKTDEDGRAFVATVGSTGGIDESDDIYLSNNYRYYPFELDLNPGTTLPWTPIGFNNEDFGQKVSI